VKRAPALTHDVLIVDLKPNEAAFLLRALRAAAIVAHAYSPTAVRVSAKRNRMFAADDVALIVAETLPTRTTRLCALPEVPFGERPPATQLG
jgi:hypothetical protein